MFENIDRKGSTIDLSEVKSGKGRKKQDKGASSLARASTSVTASSTAFTISASANTTCKDAFASAMASASASAHAPLSGHTSPQNAYAHASPTAHVSVSTSPLIGRCFVDEEGRLYGITGVGSESPLAKVKSCANKVVGKKATTAKKLGMPKIIRGKKHGVNPNSQTGIKILEPVNAKRKADNDLVATQKSQHGGSKTTKGKQKMWRI
ncbi:hypothetical protein REPUB_Repub14bG0021300 [Reevesia pubescens]